MTARSPNEKYEIRRVLSDGRVLTCPMEVASDLRSKDEHDEIRLVIAEHVFTLLDQQGDE